MGCGDHPFSLRQRGPGPLCPLVPRPAVCPCKPGTATMAAAASPGEAVGRDPQSLALGGRSPADGERPRTGGPGPWARQLRAGRWPTRPGAFTGPSGVAAANGRSPGLRGPCCGRGRSGRPLGMTPPGCTHPGLPAVGHRGPFRWLHRAKRRQKAAERARAGWPGSEVRGQRAAEGTGHSLLQPPWGGCPVLSRSVSLSLSL